MAAQQVVLDLDALHRIVSSIADLLKEVDRALNPHRPTASLKVVEGSARRRSKPRGKLAPVKGGAS